MENRDLTHRLKNIGNVIIELEKISDIRNSPYDDDLKLLDKIDKAFYDVYIFLIDYKKNRNYHYVDKETVEMLCIKLFNFYKLYLVIHNIYFYLNNIYESCITINEKDSSNEMKESILHELKVSIGNLESEISSMTSFVSGVAKYYSPKELEIAIEKEEIEEEFLDNVISTYLVRTKDLINSFDVCDIFTQIIKNGSMNKKEAKNFKEYKQRLKSFWQECLDLIIDLDTVIDNKSDLITRRVLFLDSVVNKSPAKK